MYIQPAVGKAARGQAAGEQFAPRQPPGRFMHMCLDSMTAAEKRRLLRLATIRSQNKGLNVEQLAKRAGAVERCSTCGCTQHAGRRNLVCSFPGDFDSCDAVAPSSKPGGTNSLLDLVRDGVGARVPTTTVKPVAVGPDSQTYENVALGALSPERALGENEGGACGGRAWRRALRG